MLYEDPCAMVGCGVFIVTARVQRALMRLSTRARHANTTKDEHTHKKTHGRAQAVFTSIESVEVGMEILINKIH